MDHDPKISGFGPQNTHHVRPSRQPAGLSGSHATTWITVIVAVPLLHLLTMPAVVAVAVPSGSLGTALGVPSGSSAVPRPRKWLDIYITPALWLCKADTFSNVYAPYCQWVWKTMLKRTDVV